MTPERHLGGRGTAFERLVADILNEDAPRAQRAPLLEDLFEWTDLRVKYPDLPRKRGARVQVKLISDQTVEDRRTARWHHPETYVLLSPVQLAAYVETCFDQDRGDWVGDAFWRSLPGNPADARELASMLHDVFQAALANPRPSPLGPMAHVPLPIREFIRSYVKAMAFGATEQLRKSPSERRLRHRWRRRFQSRPSPR